MTDIGPGDWVECVDDGPAAWPGMPHIARGALYQVDRLGNGLGVPCAICGTTGSPGIYLTGQTYPRNSRGGYNVWCIHRFRPIRSDITEIERILTEPLPELEDA